MMYFLTADQRKPMRKKHGPTTKHLKISIDFA